MELTSDYTLQSLTKENQTLKNQLESLKQMYSDLQKELIAKPQHQIRTIAHSQTAHIERNPNKLSLPINQPFKVSLTAEEQLEENSTLRLIHSCFIIQKNIKANHKDFLVYSFPSSYPKDIFEMASRYAFGDSTLKEINDDENNSRKIQICYDTSLFQEVRYCFDFQPKDGLKKTSFEKESNLQQKRYVFGIIKTELSRLDDIDYETEVMYGFVSMAPLQSCFTQLLRIMLQESKILMTYDEEYSKAKAKRAFSFAQIMKSLTSRTILANLSVSAYPINFELGTAYNSLRVSYQSPQIFQHAEVFRLGSILKSFSPLKICKVLHYLMAQESIIVTCLKRKTLNMLMEAIEIMLRPLHWKFPIVYSYSPFFLPFLNSPFPVLVGNVGHFSPQGDHSLTEIFVQEEEKVDRQMHYDYEEEINKLTKKLMSSLNKTVKLSSKHCVIEVNEGAYQIKQYVMKLVQKNETEQSKETENKSCFLESFIDSQMMSHYLQPKNEQGKT